MGSTSTAIATRDTIPRVQHIAYFHAALTGIRNGLSYDQLRRNLRVRAAEHGGRITSSRVEDAYTHWSPTTDSISELMRLGLVKPRTLPSKRTAVDLHRESKYELTDRGDAMLACVGEDFAAFRREITPILIRQHPHLAALCRTLSDGPLLIPEYTEEGLKSFKSRSSSSWVRPLAEDAAKRLTDGMSQATVTEDRVCNHLRDWLSRRFRPQSVPSNKEVLDTVLDAIVVASLDSRGLVFDATTFNVLSSWGRQLSVLNESRYVHGMAGRTVWSTASIELDDVEVEVRRRTLSEFRGEVVNALAASYRNLADHRTLQLGSGAGGYPYLEIYAVRALTAFSVRVNDGIVDRVIAEIHQNICSAPFRIELSLGSGSWAGPSESPFKIGSRRYNVMLIKPEGGDK